MIHILEVITDGRSTKTCRKKEKRHTVLPAEGFSSPLLHSEVVGTVFSLLSFLINELTAHLSACS